MAYTLQAVLTLGAANTGLTLTPALFTSDNVSAAGLTTTQNAEIAAGTGIYSWEGTVPDGHRGYLRFASGATVLAAVSVNPQEVENPDVKTSTTRTITLTGAQIAAILSGTTVTFRRGETNILSLTGLGDISGRDKLWFTAKRHKEQTDAQAVVQIEETEGLIRLVGATAATPGDGGITVTDAVVGDIDIDLQAASAALLEILQSGAFDVQMLDGTTVTTLTEGIFNVDGDVTRAVS